MGTAHIVTRIDRVIYLVVGLLVIIICNTFLVRRLFYNTFVSCSPCPQLLVSGQFERFIHYSKLSLTHIIVLSIYFLGCGYGFSLVLLYDGIGVFDQSTCRVAITLCMVFYLGQKYILHIFLVERTRTARLFVLD